MRRISTLGAVGIGLAGILLVLGGASVPGIDIGWEDAGGSYHSCGSFWHVSDTSDPCRSDRTVMLWWTVVLLVVGLTLTIWSLWLLRPASRRRRAIATRAAEQSSLLRSFL